MLVQPAERIGQAGQMELLPPLLDRRGQRRPDAPALGAEQAGNPDRRPAQVGGDVLVRGHADRGEQQPQAEGQPHPRVGHLGQG